MNGSDSETSENETTPKIRGHSILNGISEEESSLDELTGKKLIDLSAISFGKFCAIDNIVYMGNWIATRNVESKRQKEEKIYKKEIRKRNGKRKK